MSKTKLENFNKLEVNIEFKEIIDKFADDTVKGLRNKSPRGHRRSKTYAQGWEIKEDNRYSKKKSGIQIAYGVRVWNATNYQLTHLLEKGHLIVNKKGGVGWASAKPHIDVVYNQIKEPFIRAMENAKKEVVIK